MAAIVRLFAGQQDKKASTATALSIWQSAEITKGTRPKSGHTWKSMVQPFRHEAYLGAQHDTLKQYFKSTCQTAVTTLHNEVDGVLLSKERVLTKLQKHVQHSHSHIVIVHYAGPADCHGNPLFADEEVVTCNELLEVWMLCRGPSQLLVLMLDCPNSNQWVTALSARHPAQRVVLSCAVQAVDAGSDCRTGAASAWLAVQQWKKLKLQHAPQVAPSVIASRVASSFCCTWGGDALMDFGLPFFFMSTSAAVRLPLTKGADSAEPSPFKTLTWQDDTEPVSAAAAVPTAWPTPVGLRPRASLDMPTTYTLVRPMNNTALSKRASVNTVCPEVATAVEAVEQAVRQQPPTGALSASFATWSIKTHNSGEKQPMSDSNLAALGNTYAYERKDTEAGEESLPLQELEFEILRSQSRDRVDSSKVQELRQRRRAGEYGEHATDELLDSDAFARNMVTQDSSALTLPKQGTSNAQYMYGNGDTTDEPREASKKRSETAHPAGLEPGQSARHTEQHRSGHSNQYIDTLSLELLRLVPDTPSERASDNLIRVGSTDDPSNVYEGTDVRGSHLLTSNIKPEAIFAMLQALRSSTGAPVAACASERLIQKVIVAGASCTSDSSLLDTWENSKATSAGRTQIDGDEASDVLFSDEATRWEYLKQLVAGRPDLEQELTALQPVAAACGNPNPADGTDTDRLSRLSATRTSALGVSPAFRLLQAMSSRSGRTLAEDVSYQLMRQILESTENGRNSCNTPLGVGRAAGRTQLQGCELADEVFADDAQRWAYLRSVVAGDYDLEQELLHLQPV